LIVFKFIPMLCIPNSIGLLCLAARSPAAALWRQKIGAHVLTKPAQHAEPHAHAGQRFVSLKMKDGPHRRYRDVAAPRSARAEFDNHQQENVQHTIELLDAATTGTWYSIV
jgi:hypothetical protein